MLHGFNVYCNSMLNESLISNINLKYFTLIFRLLFCIIWLRNQFVWNKDQIAFLIRFNHKTQSDFSTQKV